MKNEQNSPTSEYLLLFRGTDWFKTLSPEQMQQVMTQWKQWFEGLSNAGKVKAGQPLVSTGKIVSGRKGRAVADGPFAESKEAIAGYFLVQVGTIEEAVAIAQQCPGLEYGATVEVRPIADECPVSEAARQHEAQAALAGAVV